jgi:hypothetical protein
MLAGMNNPIRDSIARWLDRSEPWCIAGRRSLVATYPVLAAALAPGSEIPTMMAIVAALDRGEDPTEAIPVLLGIQPESFRALKGVAPETVGREWLEHPIELLRALDLLMPSSLPKTSQDWAALWEYWIACDLHGWGNYGQPAYGSAWHPALEHLFRGLSNAGYGPAGRALGRKLMLHDTWPNEYAPTFLDYFQFIYAYLIPVAFAATAHGQAALRTGDIACPRQSGPGWAGAFLVRYPAETLVEQWTRWIAAGGALFIHDDDATLDEATRILRWVLPDFDSVIEDILGS